MDNSSRRQIFEGLIAITSVQKALQIIEHLSTVDDGQTVAEISAALSLPRSTVYRLTDQLIEAEYVVADADRKLTLSIKLVRLVNRVSIDSGIVSIATPFLRSLTAVEGVVAAQVAVLYGATALFLATQTGISSPFRLHTAVGGSEPAYCTALGKALLSGLPDDEVRRVLRGSPMEQRTPWTIVEPEVLVDELKDVRERGYATAVREWASEVWSVASPFVGPVTRSVLTIGVSLPYSYFSEERLEDVAGRVVAAAEGIAGELAL